MLKLCKIKRQILIVVGPLLVAIVVFTTHTPYNIAHVLAQTPDITPPTTTYVQTPSSPDGNSSWYVTPVQFDLSATDLESGVAEINYRIDSGTWQKVSFSNTQNLAPNPSFETLGATTTGMTDWEVSVADPEGAYAQNITDYAPGYGIASAEVVTTGGAWHGINNKLSYVPVTLYDNMSASVWFKIVGVSGISNFKVMALQSDNSEIQIASSTNLTGTTGWTKLAVDFTITDPNTIGVFLDIGHTGPGTLLADAVSINSSLTETSTTVIIGSDSENHRFEFYSVDNDGNIETYTCTGSNCVDFKLDTTPPTNWRDSGAFRGWFGPSNHHLYVYTFVDDITSGLSVFTDVYQYKTTQNPDFGKFSNIMSCSSTWQPNAWVWPLITPPFSNGVKSALLITPKTDFCDSNWKNCKTVRFKIEDLAGNVSTKDFCINGPWIRLRGEGSVKSNYNIDMISEPNSNETNTDGLIEAVNATIDFFTSSRGWKVANAEETPTLTYQELYDMTTTKNNITGQNLQTGSDVYEINQNFEIKANTLPNNYNIATFDQIVFVNGDLLISKDVSVAGGSTALFVVSGNVDIDKNVTGIGIAILADGTISTAYNRQEDESSSTLVFNGLYSANTWNLQRTLQGTNNDNFPSEDFNYEPKYLIQLKPFFINSAVTWR